MQCPRCGQANADAAQFCATCGQSFVTEPTAAPPRDVMPGYAPPTPATDEPQPGVETGLYAGASAPETGIFGAPPPQETGPFAGSPPAAPSPAVTPRYSAPPPPVAPGYDASPPVAQGYSAPPPAAPGYGAPPIDPAGGPQPVPPQTPGPPATFANPCRVCGMLVSSQSDRCMRCGTPVGMIVNPNDPTASSYIPVGAPVGMPGPGMQGVNTSGRRGEVPAELQRGWNWGAAFVTFFWAIAHGVWSYVVFNVLFFALWIFLSTMAGITNATTWQVLTGLTMMLWLPLFFFFRIYFGIRGNRIAWRYRQFENPYHCLYVQDAWKPWGMVLSFFVSFGYCCVVLLFLYLFIQGALSTGAQ